MRAQGVNTLGQWVWLHASNPCGRARPRPQTALRKRRCCLACSAAREVAGVRAAPTSSWCGAIALPQPTEERLQHQSVRQRHFELRRLGLDLQQVRKPRNAAERTWQVGSRADPADQVAMCRRCAATNSRLPCLPSTTTPAARPGVPSSPSSTGCSSPPVASVCWHVLARCE